MLCRRCAGLLKATGPANVRSQTTNRALSTSSILQNPLRLLSQAKPQLRHQLPTSQSSSKPPSISSQFHNSASRYRPAASSSESDPPSTTTSSPEKPDFLDEAESVIWDRLVKEFDPVELVVQDISGGCGSMYGIEISSEKFRGANMLKQQRMVNAVLGDLLKGWHGCQLKTRIP
ncbi:unnamed protein product [Discula destructiva]